MPALLLVADDGDNSDGLTWATAYQNITTALTSVDAGGVIKVASEHIQTVAAPLSLGSTNGTLALPVTIISVNKDDSDAYLAMRDDAAPGKIECSGNNSMTITNGTDIYIGVTLDVGNDLNLNQGGGGYRFIDCKFLVDDNVVVGAGNHIDHIVWENCHYEQITIGGFNITYGSKFIWNGGSYSFNGGSTTTVFKTSVRGTTILKVSDVDFQDLDAGDTLVSQLQAYNVDIIFKRCKVPAALGGLLLAAPTIPGQVIKFHSVSSSDIIYQLQENYYEGQVNEDTATYRDNGAKWDSAKLHGYSYKMVSTANAIEWTRPLRFQLAPRYCDANPTITVELNTDNVVIQNDELWIEIEAPDGTTGALGNITSSRMTNITDTPANLETSTEAWTEAFGTEKPQKIEQAVTGGQAGMYTVYVCLGKPSTTAYIDAKWVVS